MGYILAVDGGGTKTDFVLLGRDGRLRRRLRLGPSNYQNIGENAAFAVLSQGVEQLLAKEGIARADLTAACLGLAGLDTPTDERVYQDMVRRIFGEGASRVRIENDCFIALHSGTLGQAGIALIAGTGSMAIACNEQGKRARSGGWGHRFGDEGSGYYIGYQAVVRSLKGRDGRGPQTQLAERIEEALGADLFDIVTRSNTADPGPDVIGSLAPLVDEAAKAGDAVARDILYDAAEEHLLAAQAITKQLTFEHRPLRFVLAGGAFRSDILRRRTVERLTAHYGAADCIRPKLPPVAGAVVLALQQAGIPFTDPVRTHLAELLD